LSKPETYTGCSTLEGGGEGGGEGEEEEEVVVVVVVVVLLPTCNSMKSANFRIF
jgi:hypothetical protein